jgi:hypothetical protein
MALHVKHALAWSGRFACIGRKGKNYDIRFTKYDVKNIYKSGDLISKSPLYFFTKPAFKTRNLRIRNKLKFVNPF